MNTIAMVSLSALLGASSALAADLPTNKPASIFSPIQPPFDWTGFYAGANGGYGWGSSGDRGGLVGGAVGQNYQLGPYVIGAEGDFDFASLKGDVNNSTGSFLKARRDFLTTERLRLGYAIDRTLFYATGGYAGGSLHSSLCDGPDGFHASRDSWRNGYPVGGVVEYAFTKYISAQRNFFSPSSVRRRFTPVPPGAGRP